MLSLALILCLCLIATGCSSEEDKNDTENETTVASTSFKLKKSYDHYTINNYDFTCMSNYDEKDGAMYDPDFADVCDDDNLATVLLLDYTYKNERNADVDSAYRLEVYQGNSPLLTVTPTMSYLYQLSDFNYSDFPEIGGIVKANKSQHITYGYILENTKDPIAIKTWTTTGEHKILKTIKFTNKINNNIASRKKRFIKQLGKSVINQGDTTISNKDSVSIKETTYKSILKDYTKKFKKVTPKLVKEYNRESKKYSGNVEELAKLSNDKVEALAEICNDGIGEMASLMNENGDDYETYEKWAEKLQDVYQKYAGKIQDAYMDSAS